MKFQYSVIGDNTQDNREWLEKVGYKLSGANVGDTLCVCVDGFYQCKNYNLGKTRFQVFLDMLKPINCIGNSPLFKAVSAMREDSDYMQWFTDGKEWFLCKRDEFRGYSEFSNSYPEFWGYNYHKATLTELQERFKEKERKMTIG